MPRLLSRFLVRSPLGSALLVLALACVGAAGVFLCRGPAAGVDPRSGQPRLHAGEFHVLVFDAGVWMAVGPAGMQELICWNGARVPLKHDALLVLEPSDRLSFDVSWLTEDDFPFYRCGDGDGELIRCRDGQTIRRPTPTP